MNPWQDNNLTVPQRAAALLADMTTAEKVYQLGSFWPTPTDRPSNVEGDVAPMESALNSGADFDDAARLGLGHITRAFGTGPVTVEQGMAALRQLQREVMSRSPHGVPAVAHEECLTGFTTYGATVYPAAIAWGATFDPQLVEQMAAAIGSDMHAVGVHQGLSPLLDVVRDYRWGRVEETIGEDPYLVGILGSAYVAGLQSAGVHATLKHFAGYSAARAGRNHAPVSIGPREFEDAILPPFEMAVRAGARSVMNSYSDVDGVPAGASWELLTHVLRERWGFSGTVVSDYWAVTFLHLMHHVAEGPAEAAALALTSGLDVELPTTGCYNHLAALVKSGTLADELLDTAVLRVLEQKVQLGLLDPTWDLDQRGVVVDLDSQRNRDIARQIAQESIVLLANDGVLPLKVGSLALVGPCGGEPRAFLGCYSFPNHVLARYDNAPLGVTVETLGEALRARLDPKVVLLEERGCDFSDPDQSGIEAAVDAARGADVAVVAVGDLAGLFGKGTSGEGCDAVDLRLPGVQQELVEAVLATRTPTVLLVVSGRPYALGAYTDRCKAVVQAFMPGEEGGGALADVLLGNVNPCGRLPVSVPNHPGGQPGTYLAPPLGWHSEGISNLDPRPKYPFGHGLGYTSFEFSDLSLSQSEVDVAGELKVSVSVTNSGQRAGHHVVQLYASDMVGQVVRPLKELVGFCKVALEPGQTRRVTFELSTDRLSFTGVTLDRVVEPGRHVLSVGHSSEDRPLRAELTVTGELRHVGDGRILTTPVTVD